MRLWKEMKTTEDWDRHHRVKTSAKTWPHVVHALEVCVMLNLKVVDQLMERKFQEAQCCRWRGYCWLL